MTTTPEQIASLTQAHTAAHRDLLDFSTSLENRVAAKQQQVDITSLLVCSEPLRLNLLI